MIFESIVFLETNKILKRNIFLKLSKRYSFLKVKSKSKKKVLEGIWSQKESGHRNAFDSFLNLGKLEALL